jgi:hypothetical protein
VLVGAFGDYQRLGDQRRGIFLPTGLARMPESDPAGHVLRLAHYILKQRFFSNLRKVNKQLVGILQPIVYIFIWCMRRFL